MAAKWTEQETQFLINKAGEISAEHIGIALGRSTLAINTRAEKLGVSLAVERKRWDEDQDATLKEMLLAGHSRQEIGLAVGHSKKGVDARIYELRRREASKK